MEYAHPEVLVDTQWVADNFKDSGSNSRSKTLHNIQKEISRSGADSH